jgi:uncharacterized protein (TIGR03067 family)
LQASAGSFEIRLDSSPLTSTVTRSSTTPIARRWLGIYQLDGDTLKWCVGRKARPSEFETKQGAFLLVLRRKGE